MVQFAPGVGRELCEGDFLLVCAFGQRNIFHKAGNGTPVILVHLYLHASVIHLVWMKWS